VGNEMAEFDQLAIATLRGLAMDGPAAARSGHQGTAMALAPLGQVLYSRILRYDPTAPNWADRDRFVLSAGHASILLYGLLHLAGYDLALDDLRQFRQLGSRTPGHPEVGHTPGVEVTTGPLGQGFANAVGLALAERRIRAQYGAELCDHATYVVAGDGCLEEGVSHEAASLAGRQGLGRLIAIYDDNRITIDGATDLALSDDPVRRFEAYGWQVLDLGDAGEDLDTIEAALRTARAEESRPSLIVLRTHIATPSPDWMDRHQAHGLAFSAEDIARTKAILGLDPDANFQVLAGAREGYARQLPARIAEREAWESRVAESAARSKFQAQLAGIPTGDLAAAMPHFEVGSEVATRNALKACLQAAAPLLDGLVAGSADLTENTGVALALDDVGDTSNPGGRQLHFGIREHAMGSAMNGMALHGGILPIGGTFFVFSDYLRPAIRLAALSRAKVLYAFTHDSVGVGEDGPTHQPIEHLASLRAMPGLEVLRPADANETAACVVDALSGEGPVALVLSRQNLPVLEGTDAGGVARGGYVLRAADAAAVVLVGSGSEVSLCVEAAQLLADEGIAARVVSMPSLTRFLGQPASYREAVLGGGLPVISVEAGATFGWSAVADVALGIDRFGLSAPAPAVFAELGLTANAIAAVARQQLQEDRS